MRLKILMIGWFYSPVVGGAETVMRLLAEELVGKKHSVTVLCSGSGCDVIKGVHVVRQPLINKSKSDAEEFSVWFERFLDENGFDIVHCHNVSLNFNVDKSLLIVNSCRSRGIPIIEHSHNAQLTKSRATRPVILFDFDRIICVSKFVYARISGLRDKRNLAVLYNPVDLDFFSQDNADPLKVDLFRRVSRGCRILFPARPVYVSKRVLLQKQKQLYQLLMACILLKKKGFSFTLIVPGTVGQPGLDKYKAMKGSLFLHNFVKRMKLNGYVRILDAAVPLEDMPSLYSACDIVCMPGINETFGMAFAEAQAMGKPIVASRSGGALEVIEDGVSGLLFEPKNVVDLADKLSMLIGDNNMRSAMGAAGMKRIGRLFSKEKVIKDLLAIYKSVIFANIIPFALRRLHYGIKRLLP